MGPELCVGPLGTYPTQEGGGEGEEAQVHDIEGDLSILTNCININLLSVKRSNSLHHWSHENIVFQSAVYVHCGKKLLGQC